MAGQGQTTASNNRVNRDRSGKPKETWSLLEPIYARFNEGYDTADLKAAKAVLDELKKELPTTLGESA